MFWNLKLLLIHACLTVSCGLIPRFSAYYYLLAVRNRRPSTFHHQRSVCHIEVIPLRQITAAFSNYRHQLHQQNSDLPHMRRFKKSVSEPKPPKNDPPGGRASGQSSASLQPDSSHRSFRDWIGRRSRTSSPSRVVDNTPDGAPASQSQTASALVQAHSSYPGTPILQIHRPHLVSF